MKVAIVGTGIAGNVAAYHLNKEHDITVFEANDYVGGHTHTHHIERGDQTYAVDTGFIVYNERTYPHFIALLEQLGVGSRETEMSFSVRHEGNGLEYNGHSLNTLFAQRINLFKPSFYCMIRDILRFNREAPKSLEDGSADVDLGEYLRRGHYSREFVDHYIIPMGAAIWSTDLEQMQRIPARFFIRFFDHHGLLQVQNRPRWFTIEGGSKSYIEPLIKDHRTRIRLSSPVTCIRRFSDHVLVTAEGEEAERFDAVFIASHSDEALGMLSDPSVDEQTVLGAMDYQSNDVTLHTDTSVLPHRSLAWAAWNYHLSGEPQDKVAVTYNMNMLQGLSAPETFCVTLNNDAGIDENKVIKRMQYDHPVFTAESMAAQARQKDINGPLRTYFCGAYWRNGFHEDGVYSALEALKHFEQSLHE